ncbi:MAG: family 16 glycosylhydrolase [Aquabacterium sp.]
MRDPQRPSAFIRRARALVAAGALWAAVGAAAAAAAPDKTGTALAVPVGYHLVWADEFERDGLPDPHRWAHDTGMNKAGWHNRELQYYAGPRADNARVQGGRLHITARKEALASAPDWGGQRYTSARLITQGRGEWVYGFFEIRARLPCGAGTWPAIWMLNRDAVWPAGGELDIMEHIGREPGRVFSTVHMAAGHGGSGVGAARKLPDACTVFHNYQMHWTPDVVRFGIDGVVHFEYRNPRSGKERWPFDGPQFLILNIAVGGDLGGAVDDTVFPVTLEVDHVRVFQARRP